MVPDKLLTSDEDHRGGADMRGLSLLALALGLLLTPSWLVCAAQTPSGSKEQQVRRNPAHDDPFYADMDGPISSVGDAKLNVSDISLGWNPDDKHTTGFIAYCAANGVKLSYVKSGYWRVTEPKVRNQSLEVRIRAFPDTASIGQMRLMMWQVQIHCGLNAKAHIAMTPPGLDVVERAKLPAEVIRAIEASEEHKALVGRLKDLLVNYSNKL
jgi:hypothetical protein